MFEAKRLLFYNCVSPLHVGAGTAVGAIDNPIQREVHSGHPLMAGSGLKGAVRHHLRSQWRDHEDIVRFFGPESKASLNAGAIAFSDAVLVCFPVRSAASTFVYATSAYCLARLDRLARTAGLPVDWHPPHPSEGRAHLASAGAVHGGRVALEAFEYEAVVDPDVESVATWLADNAFPDGDAYGFFREKLKKDLVVLPDHDFGHFVRHSTVVEPHVRIDDATGTADGGGLFYTENLPPESLLAGLVLSSIERTKDRHERAAAEAILQTTLEGNGDRRGISGTVVQMGGDATTGRGLVVVQPAAV